MTYAAGLAADRDKRYEAAADRYEQALTTEEDNPLLWLDLALLHWEASDPGNHLGRNLAQRASSRDFLAEAVRRFPDDVAIAFWSKYIGWTDFGGDITNEDCLAFMARDPSVLVPVLYLYTHTDGRAFGAPAVRLLRSSERDGTAGARYVASVLRGAMMRRGEGD